MVIPQPPSGLQDYIMCHPNAAQAPCVHNVEAARALTDHPEQDLSYMEQVSYSCTDRTGPLCGARQERGNHTTK